MLNMRKKYIVSVIVFILLVFMYLFYNSITYGKEIMVFTSSSSNDTIKKILQSSKSGETLDITSAEINGILEMYKGNIYNKQKNIKIERILCNIEKDSIEFYIPTEIYNINSLIRIKGNIKYEDNNFIIIPEYFKIGKIKISKKIVLNKLKGIENEKIKFDDNMIIISSQILPMDVKNFTFNEKSITLIFPKPEEIKQEIVANTSEIKQDTKLSQEEIKKNQLKTVYSQLGNVYNNVKTSDEKAIISNIKAVVNKMINDSNYPYQNEAASVKGSFNKLSEEEKSDVKNAILMNMSTTSLRMLNQTFKLL